MPRCYSCGNEIDAADRFCRYCGAEINTGAPVPTPLGEETAAPPPTETPLRQSAAQRDTPPPTAPKDVPAAEPEGEDYVYPAQRAKKKGGCLGKFISLLLVVVLLVGAVGGLKLWEDEKTAAFSPVESVYSDFTTGTVTYLSGEFYPELFSALQERGFTDDGYWAEKRSSWTAVYGNSVIAVPTLNGAALVRGEEKDAYLEGLYDAYGVYATPTLIFKLDYTVSVSGGVGSARLKQSTYVGKFGNKWYIIDELF